MKYNIYDRVYTTFWDSPGCILMCDEELERYYIMNLDTGDTEWLVEFEITGEVE